MHLKLYSYIKSIKEGRIHGLPFKLYLSNKYKQLLSDSFFHLPSSVFFTSDIRHPTSRAYFKICLEITIFWISEVPSPIVHSLASR